MIKQLTLFVAFIVTGAMATIVAKAVLDHLPQALQESVIYNGCTFGCNSHAMSVIWSGCLMAGLFTAVAVTSLYMAVANRQG